MANSLESAEVLDLEAGPMPVPGAGVLIVNADDWGRDQENTQRILDCVLSKTVSSVSAMVFMEDSERAAGIAGERSIDAGLHLNLTTAFSGPGVPSRLNEHQQRLSRYLLRHRFALIVFYPWLAASFEYVVNAQLEEFSRLYGAKPERIDGHHHMHLCANVLLGKLLPEGTIVRRNFSFQSGEKSLVNRIYRGRIDRMLARRYRLVDLFFALEPMEPADRLQQIFSQARRFAVEVETHPVNPNEYRFLQGGEIIRRSGSVQIASHFALPRSSDTKAASPTLTPRATTTKQRVVRPTVLIGFAEAATAAEVAWSLVDGGCDVIAFARKGRSSALRHSRHVVCHDICAPEVDLDASLSDLRSVLSSLNNKPSAQQVLFPLDDNAVLLCNRVQLGEDWVLAGPDGAHAELALNKYLQIQMAGESGFDVPKTALARTAADIRGFITAESFPIILKSAECVPVQEGRAYTCPQWICANDDELKRALAQWGERVPLLVQSFIIGTGEGIFGLAAPDGVRAWSAHRRLRMMNPQGSGSSACISQPMSEGLRRKAEGFVERTGWRGMFMIELLRDRSGKVWFVELNGRPWGSMALSRRQGLEYPAWQVSLAVNPQSQAGTAVSPAPGIVSRNAGRELMHLLFVLRGPKSQALGEWPSFWKSVADVARFRQGDTLYNWRREDLKVFLADVCYSIKTNLFKSKN
jgi:predicted glycoside hydrolase/deacetylase ChbG (UPF0249 family)/predicted ATP-grasp superfamily ATP-dependent carboligase